MTGNQLSASFISLFTDQVFFQNKIEKSWPEDNPTKFQYHVTALQEEIGEVLKADKRWKTHRNASYDKAEKLDEIADCFITMMNISMWSGFSSDQILNAISVKIERNNSRLEKE